jgi:hypothetical protein
MQYSLPDDVCTAAAAVQLQVLQVRQYPQEPGGYWQYNLGSTMPGVFSSTTGSTTAGGCSSTSSSSTTGSTTAFLQDV